MTHHAHVDGSGNTPPYQVEQGSHSREYEKHHGKGRLGQQQVGCRGLGQQYIQRFPGEKSVGTHQPQQGEPAPVAEGGYSQNSQVNHDDVHQDQPVVRQVGAKQDRREECADNPQDANDNGLVTEGQQSGQRHHQGQEQERHIGPDKLIESKSCVDGQVENRRPAGRHRPGPDGNAPRGVFARAHQGQPHANAQGNPSGISDPVVVEGELKEEADPQHQGHRSDDGEPVPAQHLLPVDGEAAGLQVAGYRVSSIIPRRRRALAGCGRYRSSRGSADGHGVLRGR